MSFLYFKSNKGFYNWLLEQGVELDINASYKASRYTFCTEDGKRYFHKKISDMCLSLNTLLPEDVQLDEKRCVPKGASHLKIYLKGEDDAVQEENFQPLIQVEEKEELQEEVEEVDLSGLAEAISKVEELEEPTFDLDHALTLKESGSKAEQKQALQSYAKEFGIEIEVKKNKTFDVMIDEIKESL